MYNTRGTRGQLSSPTVFGIDELELNIAGTMRGNIATCTGTTDAAPGMVMEATLVLCQSASSIPKTPRA